MSSESPYANLPGWELVEQGLSDIRAERLSPEACLVWIAEPRLRNADLLPVGYPPIPEPERMLYALLREDGSDAYPKYQSLLRRIAKFVRAL